MSQGAEKSQPPEVGIEPGPQDLKANTLPRRCKNRLPPQGGRNALYTYTYYIEAVERLVLTSAKLKGLIFFLICELTVYHRNRK